MTSNKLLTIANIGQKLFSDNFKPDYIGGLTYKYDKDIFSDDQMDFLRQFEGKTMDMFLTNPTNFEKYDKTIVVTEEGDTIKIADDFRRVIFHYVTDILKEDLQKFLDIIDSNDFMKRDRLDYVNEKNILIVTNVEALMKYFASKVPNYTIVEKFLAIRRYWMINGYHHEIYKYKIREALKTKVYNFSNFPALTKMN